MQSNKQKTYAQYSSQIFWLEGSCFFLFILLDWLDEVLDLPHKLFRAPATPINYTETIMETVCIIIIGIIIISTTRYLLAQIRVLEGYIPMCANCKKVRLPNSQAQDPSAWVPLEEFLTMKSEALISHSCCPECAEKLFKDIHQITGKAKP